MATVYLADLYEVREEPDADSAVEGSLPSGSRVLLKDVAIDGGSVWYYVMFAVDGQERYGYIEAAHLVTSDTDFRAWEEKLGAADEVAGEKLKKSGNQDILAFPESYRAALTQLKSIPSELDVCTDADESGVEQCCERRDAEQQKLGASEQRGQLEGGGCLPERLVHCVAVGSGILSGSA